MYMNLIIKKSFIVFSTIEYDITQNFKNYTGIVFLFKKKTLVLVR